MNQSLTSFIITRSLSNSTGGAATAADARLLSDSAGKPRRDLLHYPRITIGIIEGAEGPVARALGVGPAEPRFRGKRRPMPHLSCVDAAVDQVVVGRFNVGDDECPLGGTRRAAGDSLAKRDRAP